MGICTSKSSVKSNDRDENKDIPNQTRNIDSPKLKMPDSKQEQAGQEPERSEGIQETNAPNESINPVAQNKSGKIIPKLKSSSNQKEGNKGVNKVKKNKFPNMDINKAATVIQAAYRGYHVRKLHSKKGSKKVKAANNTGDESSISHSSITDSEESSQKSAHLKITKVLPTSPEIDHDQREDNIENVERINTSIPSLDPDTAATKIQAVFKGHQVRKNQHNKNKFTDEKHIDYSSPHEPDDKHQAATTVQQDKHLNDIISPFDANEAALKIQAAFKGHQVRKNLKLHELGHADPNNVKANKKIEIIEPPQDFKSSTTIARDITIPQETGDIKLDPESGLELMKEQEAATKIQAAFKGFQVRKNLEKDITSPN